jgi:uncharacterized protein (TIGR02594 family)
MGVAVTRQIQQALADFGYDPGPVDGIYGPKTAAAVRMWQAGASVTLEPGDQPAVLPVSAAEELPWMAVARAHLGLHETRDHAELLAFLKSDHASVGDPAKLPWCGDFVETCIKLGLPSEMFTGRVKENPYFARNWLEFGTYVPPTYGAIVVFERGPTSGHIGFLVGQDASCFYVLGGNQSDAVTVARIEKTRALGYRWPNAWPAIVEPLPQMTPGNMTISRNEA